MSVARFALLLVPLSASASTAAAGAPILVTTDDMEGRRYEVVAELEVTARKATLFSPSPTPEDTDRKLRQRAEKLGADAVILVRYGRLRTGLTSWRVRTAHGVAIRFVDDVEAPSPAPSSAAR